MPTPSYPWVVRDGEPALPYDYVARTGTSDDPRYVNYTGYTAYGTARQPTYGAPVYTTKDLDSMWGKGRPYVFGTNDLLYRMGYMNASIASRPTWSQEAQKALQNAMADANRNGMTLDQMYKALMEGQDLKYGPSGGGAGAQKQTSTSTSVSYNLTTREAAQQVLAQVLSQELGRAPTAAELSAFLRTLNSVERAHPSVSTSTSVYDPATGHTSSSSTSKSYNVSASGEAEKWTKDNKKVKQEQQSYQGALYYDVISRMVGL